jgi:hypothetical protein
MHYLDIFYECNFFFYLFLYYFILSFIGFMWNVGSPSFYLSCSFSLFLSTLFSEITYLCSQNIEWPHLFLFYSFNGFFWHYFNFCYEIHLNFCNYRYLLFNLFFSLFLFNKFYTLISIPILCSQQDSSR